MERDHNKKIVTISMTLGIILILTSLITVTAHHFSQKNAAEGIQQITSEIKAMMPETESGTTNQSSDPEMPVVEIEGNDFAGIIEIPKYNKLLPVYSEWNKRRVSDYPCRYMGSMYDGSLIIGTVENPGQFDITKLISGGDDVTLTDVTGLEYSYIITDIYKTKDVSTESLTAAEGELVLFVRSMYGRDYMIICCGSR